MISAMSPAKIRLASGLELTASLPVSSPHCLVSTFGKLPQIIHQSLL